MADDPPGGLLVSDPRVGRERNKWGLRPPRRQNGPLRNAVPGASLPPVSTSGNPTLCGIRAPRSVDPTDDLGLAQMPRGSGFNLCAR